MIQLYIHSFRFFSIIGYYKIFNTVPCSSVYANTKTIVLTRTMGDSDTLDSQNPQARVVQKRNGFQLRGSRKI